MSRTIPSDVASASYWSYMAGMMAQQLESIIHSGEVRSNEILKGVYTGALEFFTLVLPAAGDGVPEDPLASMNAYVIAADALRGSLGNSTMAREELNTYLGQYSTFVNDLLRSRVLTAEEIATAKNLRRFFVRLEKDGEAEVYEDVLYLADPSLAGIIL